jgi:hypothetical protein
MQLLGLLAVILIDPGMYATRKTVKRKSFSRPAPKRVGQSPQSESLKGLPEHLKIERVTDGNHPGPAPSK